MKTFILAIIIVITSVIILMPYINNVTPKKVRILKSTDSSYIKFSNFDSYVKYLALKIN